MRKTSYVVALFAVALTLTLNVLSAQRDDWLTTRTSFGGISARVRYGLTRRCQSDKITMPGGEWRSFDCRPFPARDEGECEDADGHKSGFCAAWTTASYFDSLAIGFGAVAILAIIFGLSTHSRRRRIWKSVAWLVALHALCQIVAFAIITHVFVHRSYAGFDRARPAAGYGLNVTSWILAVLVAFGVVTTGLSASAGHRWAAGNRHNYEPIAG